MELHHLLACPWCGKIGALTYTPAVGHFSIRRLQCEKCDIMGPAGMGLNGAADKWNARVRTFMDGLLVEREPERAKTILDSYVAMLAKKFPRGTPCWYWPGVKQGPGKKGVINAWTIHEGRVVASLIGIGGHVRDTHVECEPQNDLTLF
jgi:hypothetical protein